MSQPAAGMAAHGLRTLVQQTVLSGASRRAALLHMDRLPPPLARPHHLRLARSALAGLADRDHAQSFDLSRGRLAIVWRSRAPDDIDAAMAALAHLMADLPAGQAIAMGELLSVFDLPAQAPWLLDALAEPDPGADPPSGHGMDPALGLDAPLLAALEESLVQADLAPFLRWRPVIDIERGAPALAWEERTLAIGALAGCLCPGRHLAEGTWLFRRLARSLDRRMLALLTGPRELGGNRPFSLAITVGSILSPAFMAFDAALPAGLRGRVVLALEAADILADAASFSFARNFAHARLYRLLLRDAPADPRTPPLLHAESAGLDMEEMKLSPVLLDHPGLLAARERLVLSGVDSVSQLEWARRQGCWIVKGLVAQG